jgi:hypothetical protein
VVNFANTFFAEAAAFEPNSVQSKSAGAAFGGGFGERKDVAGDRRSAADEGVSADAHEVVHRAQRTNRGPILDDDVAAQGRGVGHDYVVADRAVVSDMGVSHDEVVAADASEASALDGTAIDGDELANDVVVANFEPRGLAVVADILRSKADGGKRKEVIMSSDFRGTIDGDVGDQFAGFAEFHVCADGAVRADFAGWMNFCGGIENGRGMGVHWIVKCRPCRDSVLLYCSPGTSVPGFHIPPLRGWCVVGSGVCAR